MSVIRVCIPKSHPGGGYVSRSGDIVEVEEEVGTAPMSTTEGWGWQKGMAAWM